MKIENRKIGSGEKCFIIAEAGVNHNGDVDRALKMIELAANAGADAIKFQTFDSEYLVSKSAPKALYQEKNTGTEENQFQMLKKLELPRKAYPQLIAECKRYDIIFMSTPFDDPSVDLLEDSKVKIYKIPSGEITNTPLIQRIAANNKPIILSTGMATMEEIGDAVNAVSETGNNDLILLQCTSNYPVAPADVNLRAMDSIAREFNLPVGLSDHTLGIEIAMAAVALDACVIEKHFTLDKTLPGPDHRMSLISSELEKMVSGIRNIEAAMGSGIKEPAECEKNTAQVARKSIHYKVDLLKGKILDGDNVVMLRPGDGVLPAQLADFIGKKFLKDVKAGTKLAIDDFHV